jgi:hypothetical protein
MNELALIARIEALETQSRVMQRIIERLCRDLPKGRKIRFPIVVKKKIKLFSVGDYPEMAEWQGALADAVAQSEVSAAELLSNCQKRKTAWARQDLMADLYELGYSYSQIGRALGRDHSTILYGIAQSKKRASPA